MARRRALAKYRLAEMTKTATSAPAASRPPAGKGVLFGTPDNRKVIIIMSVVGMLLFALLHFVISPEGQLSVAALIFTAVHGALLGMLIGQVMLVYPDRVMVVFVVMAVLLGETVYLAATKQFEHFEFNVERLRDMTAIFFWAGWVGFWLGFIVLVKRAKRRRLFQMRFQAAAEELPAEDIRDSVSATEDVQNNEPATEGIADDKPPAAEFTDDDPPAEG